MTKTMDKYFGADGALSEVIEGYEVRPRLKLHRQSQML